MELITSRGNLYNHKAIQLYVKLPLWYMLWRKGRAGIYNKSRSKEDPDLASGIQECFLEGGILADSQY